MQQGEAKEKSPIPDDIGETHKLSTSPCRIAMLHSSSTNQGQDLSFAATSEPHKVTLDWPELSPIQRKEDDHDESLEVICLDDTPESALSDQAVIGTPQSVSYATPADRKTYLRHPRKKKTGLTVKAKESPHYDVALLLQQSWRKAIRVLRANPSLMTGTILCMALRQRPPVYVVDWMLRLNPDAVKPPPPGSGPSPLFEAVEQGCSTNVVETVLRACPQALVAQPPGSQWDPVALAKRKRANEKDLLALLHRPVSSWLEEEKEEEPQGHRSWSRLGAKQPNTNIIPEVDEELDQVRQKLVMSPKSPPRLGIEKRELPRKNMVEPDPSPRHHIPSLFHRTRPLAKERAVPQISSPASTMQSSWTAAERQELDNVKYLCMSLLKAHRRMLDAQEQQSSVSPQGGVAHLDASEREALLKTLEEKQEQQSRICLIALDMKERAIQGLARRLEERLSSSVTDSYVSDQVRSSYVHLYRRFLGLEEELHKLKRVALTSSSVASSSCFESDSCQAVFDPIPEQRPLEVHTM